MALVGELLFDASHELNNQLAFVLSNLQNLAEYGDELQRVMTAYRARLLASGARDDALDQLEAEVDLDFLLEDAGRAAREGLAGATRVRDVMRVLARLGEDQPVDRPLMDLPKTVRQLLAVEAKTISLRAQLDADLALEATVAAAPSLVTRAVAVLVKDALDAFDPRDKDRNRLVLRLERRGPMAALVVERHGGGASGRRLALAEEAARGMDAELVVEDARVTLLVPVA
jgi:signal transduction histidine kinase